MMFPPPGAQPPPAIERLGPPRVGSGRQHGAETVEFAITISLFLFIIFAIFEGSRLLYSFTVTGHLAREAVRYAEVRGSEMAIDPARTGDQVATKATIQVFVNRNSGGLLSPVTAYACWGGSRVPCSNLNATCPDSSGNNDPGDPVYVTVAYNFEPAVRWFSDIFPSNLCSSARGTVIY